MCSRDKSIKSSSNRTVKEGIQTVLQRSKGTRNITGDKSNREYYQVTVYINASKEKDLFKEHLMLNIW